MGTLKINYYFHNVVVIQPTGSILSNRPIIAQITPDQDNPGTSLLDMVKQPTTVAFSNEAAISVYYPPG
jgi:hypothetical protein